MTADLDPDLPPGLRRVPAPPGSDFPGPVALPTGDLLIGGEWESAQGGSRREAVDPSTGEALGTVAMAGADDVARAIGAAGDAFESWRAWPAQRRRDVLLALADLIDAHDAELAVVRSLETGAPLKRRRGSSLASEWTRYYAGWVDKLEGVTTAPYSSPSLTYTRPEPYGVVAVLTPWNGGAVSVAMKVVPALAAGNCVVLKPAELALVRAAALRRAGAAGGHPARCAQRRARRTRRRRRPRR